MSDFKAASITHVSIQKFVVVLNTGFCACSRQDLLQFTVILCPPNTNVLMNTLKGANKSLKSRLMQRFIVHLRFRSVTGCYSWLRQALDIVILSKNISWQDLRHCELDDDRRNNIMDHHSRVSVHISMRYKFQGQLGNSSSKPRVLQRREFPSNWIRCHKCLCRSCLAGATNANSQYPVLSYSAYLTTKGMAFADASRAKTRRLWSIASRLDVSMRPGIIVDFSSY